MSLLLINGCCTQVLKAWHLRIGLLARALSISNSYLFPGQSRRVFRCEKNTGHVENGICDPGSLCLWYAKQHVWLKQLSDKSWMDVPGYLRNVHIEAFVELMKESGNLWVKVSSETIEVASVRFVTGLPSVQPQAAATISTLVSLVQEESGENSWK